MYRIDVGQGFNQSLNTYYSTPFIVTKSIKNKINIIQ